MKIIKIQNFTNYWIFKNRSYAKKSIYRTLNQSGKLSSLLTVSLKNMTTFSIRNCVQEMKL